MCTDRQKDRQTECDAYEPTVHTHRWAKKCKFFFGEGGIEFELKFDVLLLCHFHSIMCYLIQLCDICKTVSQDTEAAHFCRDCNKHFCSDCIYRHKNTDVFEEHVVKDLTTKETSRIVCKEHEKEMEALKFFCQSCGVSVQF